MYQFDAILTTLNHDARSDRFLYGQRNDDVFVMWHAECAPHISACYGDETIQSTQFEDDGECQGFIAATNERLRPEMPRRYARILRLVDSVF